MRESVQHAEETDAEQAAAPAKLRRQRKERAMTQADWDKVHNANVRAERHPDPAQINILDVIGGDG